MIVVSSNIIAKQTKKVFCPECHGRICDVVVSEQVCRYKCRVLTAENADYLIAIKCQKCGRIIGIGIKQ